MLSLQDVIEVKADYLERFLFIRVSKNYAFVRI
jgi:hypothetical protein